MIARGLTLGMAALALALAGACAAEDDWVVRPPGGGGGGGGGGGVDAGGGDAGGGDVAGRLCLVTDLRFPDRCPTTSQAAGVQVHVVGGATATSDSAGRFTLPPLTGPQLIELGGTATLVAATIPIVADGGGLALPVPVAADFEDVLLSVAVPGLAGQGAVVIYVDDAAGAPLRGAVFASLPGAAYATQYDDGAATAWRSDGGTGAAGVALMLGVPAGTYTAVATAPGPRQLTISGVPVRADAVTFVRTTAP